MYKLKECIGLLVYEQLLSYACVSLEGRFRGELDRVLKASKDHVEGIATKAHQIPQHLVHRHAKACNLLHVENKQP